MLVRNAFHALINRSVNIREEVGSAQIATTWALRVVQRSSRDFSPAPCLT
jgi:hypothetical protein